MNIPALEHLKSFPHWVAWQREQKQRRDGTWKGVKMPKNPRTGGNACSDKPETWGTFEEAKQAYRRTRAAGVGCFFTAEMGMVYIDLDNCVNEAGDIAEPAQRIIEQINSYSEISPSGAGVHIVAFGTLPHPLKKDDKGVEMYTERKYLTATGRALPGLPLEIRPAHDALLAVFEQYAPKRMERPNSWAGPNQHEASPELVRDALRVIPPVMGYHDWVSVLMAVHSAFPNQEGIDLVEEWSPGYEGEVEEKFRSFRGSSTTLGTLFFHAKEHGWDRGYALARLTVGTVSMAMPEL